MESTNQGTFQTTWTNQEFVFRHIIRKMLLHVALSLVIFESVISMECFQCDSISDSRCTNEYAPTFRQPCPALTLGDFSNKNAIACRKVEQFTEGLLLVVYILNAFLILRSVLLIVEIFGAHISTQQDGKKNT